MIGSIFGVDAEARSDAREASPMSSGANIASSGIVRLDSEHGSEPLSRFGLRDIAEVGGEADHIATSNVFLGNFWETLSACYVIR
jgi:hypothetical protein